MFIVELRGEYFVTGHCGVIWLSRSMALISKPDLESQRCIAISSLYV